MLLSTVSLEKAIQLEPKMICEWASNNAAFEDLRSHPRFQSLVYGEGKPPAAETRSGKSQPRPH
ncbi:hypothetical protein [Synechococcus sp. PCC 7336]|uniref:TPR end-of-group domain-containing protein n=1 Tax=Synechococcus sp. PCC 7336 TaxID=195250 RepID=UPI00034D5022|nr:hypothetical protein [Synechococcus sp. PCC 7336]